MNMYIQKCVILQICPCGDSFRIRSADREKKGQTENPGSLASPSHVPMWNGGVASDRYLALCMSSRKRGAWRRRRRRRPFRVGRTARSPGGCQQQEGSPGRLPAAALFSPYRRATRGGCRQQEGCRNGKVSMYELCAWSRSHCRISRVLANQLEDCTWPRSHCRMFMG